MLITDESVNITRFCAIECYLQESGELSVGWMLEAWQHAQTITAPLDHADVQFLGRLVEPAENAKGYRQHDVRVGMSIKPEWAMVPALMMDLLDDQDVGPPAEWFRRYEEVHPFGDGNGRTGVILFNWMRRSLDDPKWPPNFWNDTRRLPGFGAP